MINFRKLIGETIEYPEDVERIIKVARAHNEFINDYEARAIWRAVSDDYCAGWLILPESDDDIWYEIKSYFC